jgi:hypothetical protein
LKKWVDENHPSDGPLFLFIGYERHPFPLKLSRPQGEKEKAEEAKRGLVNLKWRSRVEEE